MNTIAIPSGMETKLFVMSPDALNDVPAVLRTQFAEKQPWLVADENTWQAAGEKLSGILKKSGCKTYPPYIFPGTPLLHPDNCHAEMLATRIPPNSVPVAVGSGVINDLVKRAAGIANCPYCCVPTAASVDGYTSYGAALSVDGRKKTMPCPAPQAVVADLNILTAAPPAMLSGGYADLVTKVPAGADWLIADALGLEPIVPAVWQLVQHNLRDWIADHTNLNNVFMGLAATGYAMQTYRESRPASGAEHLMSHVWEMEGLQYHGTEVSHGFKVAIGTLAVTRLMEFVIETDVAVAQRLAVSGVSQSIREAEIDHLLVRNCYGNEARNVASAKFLTGEPLRKRRELIWSVWEDLRPRLRQQLLSFADLNSMFRRAGCPTHPAEIGLDDKQFLHGVITAQLIRQRYTILDFLYEAGLLTAAMENLSLMTSSRVLRGDTIGAKNCKKMNDMV